MIVVADQVVKRNCHPWVITLELSTKSIEIGRLDGYDRLHPSIIQEISPSFLDERLALKIESSFSHSSMIGCHSITIGAISVSSLPDASDPSVYRSKARCPSGINNFMRMM
jgi:hypothetical protein